MGDETAEELETGSARVEANADDRRTWDAGVVGQLANVAGRPWCLKPEAMEFLVHGLSGGVTAGPPFQAPEQAPVESPGTISVIGLSGVITPNAPGGMLGQLLGLGGGLSEFKSHLAKAAVDDKVKAIVLDVNSPGGLTDQVPEVAALIRRARERKPVTAVANTQAASAAYWLASQATEVVVTPSGEVGSIGCMMMHADKSEALAQAGLNVTLTSAGKYKTEGSQFEALSPEARDAIQRKVNRFYDRFVADVAAGRDTSSETVKSGFGEGRTVMAEEAVEQGLADRVASFDEVMAELITGQTPTRDDRRSLARRRADALMG